MRQVIVKETLQLDVAEGTMERVASELQARGAWIRETKPDQIIFRGTPFFPTWEPLSGVGMGRVFRTPEGLIVELSFPLLVPFCLSAAVFVGAGTLAGGIPWNVAVLAATFFPLVAYAGTRASVRRVLQIIRRGVAPS